MKEFSAFLKSLSSATKAFMLTSLFILLLILLIWPPAVVAFVTLLGAIATFLPSLTAFILALLRAKDRSPDNQSR
ncbi:MAG: hypothetical protein HXX20_06365 [Chloroflexi bacterium]|nr:hypothetical protein [Chloroflexota bacterium]